MTEDFMARLDCFQQKLPDEKVSYLYISDEDWAKAARKDRGRMVPLLSINIGGIAHIRATHASSKG